jgi:hypothetical protein
MPYKRLVVAQPCMGLRSPNSSHSAAIALLLLLQVPNDAYIIVFQHQAVITPQLAQHQMLALGQTTSVQLVTAFPPNAPWWSSEQSHYCLHSSSLERPPCTKSSRDMSISNLGSPLCKTSTHLTRASALQIFSYSSSVLGIAMQRARHLHCEGSSCTISYSRDAMPHL